MSLRLFLCFLWILHIEHVIWSFLCDICFQVQSFYTLLYYLTSGGGGVTKVCRLCRLPGCSCSNPKINKLTNEHVWQVLSMCTTGSVLCTFVNSSLVVFVFLFWLWLVPSLFSVFYVHTYYLCTWNNQSNNGIFEQNVQTIYCSFMGTPITSSFSLYFYFTSHHIIIIITTIWSQSSEGNKHLGFGPDSRQFRNIRIYAYPYIQLIRELRSQLFN